MCLQQCVPALAATEQYTESSSYASELEAIVAKRKLNLPTIEVPSIVRPVYMAQGIHHILLSKHAFIN